MEGARQIEMDIPYDYRNSMAKTKKGKIKLKKYTFNNSIISITLVSLLILTIVGIMTFDYKEIDLMQGIEGMFSNFAKMIFQPKNNHFTFTEGLYQVIVALGITFLTTVIGAAIALLGGLLAAENLTNKKVSNGIKNIVAVIRAVPTVLWVLIFAVAVGLGSVAAVIGLTFHTVGYLIKAYSEAFEEVDEGVIEALKASGANWWQIVFGAILPSSSIYLMVWTFMRFEINFANAVAMGAAAGAGGIGYQLFMAGNFYFDVREVGFITYMVLFCVIILEICSTKIKNKYLK